jgi:hypothetical protein
MALPRSIHGGDWVEAIAYPVWAAEAPEAFGARGFSASENPLGSAISSDEATPPEAGGEGPGVMTLRRIAETTGLRPTVLVADIEGTEGGGVRRFRPCRSRSRR